MKTAKRFSVNHRIGLLESLEARLLMSGNVRAWIRQGRLEVFGDQGANAITIQSTGNEIRLSGADGDTAINGQTSPQVFDGVKEIIVNLGQGQDTLVLDDVDITRVSAWLGAGDDSVRASGSVGKLSIDLGSGENAALINSLTCRDTLRLDAGRGGDSIQVSQSQMRDLQINSGAGDDSINIQQSSATVYRPIHDDSGVIPFVISATNAFLVLTKDNTGNVLIQAGSGNDVLTLDGVAMVQTTLQVDMGRGADTVSLNEMSFPDPPSSFHPTIYIIRRKDIFSILQHRINGGLDDDHVHAADQTQLQAIQRSLQSFEIQDF